MLVVINLSDEAINHLRTYVPDCRKNPKKRGRVSFLLNWRVGCEAKTRPDPVYYSVYYPKAMAKLLLNCLKEFLVGFSHSRLASRIGMPLPI